MAAVPVLIISGSLGTGKTTVLGEASDILIEHGIPHAALELDALAVSWPTVRGVPFNNWIIFENLACVWANYVRAGIDRLLIARVVESRVELDAYRRAVPAAQIQVCRLIASEETMLARLRLREPGTMQRWHLERAPILAAELERSDLDDFVVSNDERPVRSVAEEMLTRAGWI